jgi:hypothetical protein
MPFPLFSRVASQVTNLATRQKGGRMSESLYALTGQYNELYDLLTNNEEELDEEVIKDTLSAILGEIEVKSENYLKVIDRLDMEEYAADMQIKKWTAIKKLRTNGKKRMKSALAECMEQMGVKEIKAGDSIIKLVNNGGKQPIMYRNALNSKMSGDEVHIEDIPKEYRKVVVSEDKDTDKIRQALEKGEKLDFCYLADRGKHITVK